MRWQSTTLDPTVNCVGLNAEALSDLLDGQPVGHDGHGLRVYAAFGIWLIGLPNGTNRVQPADERRKRGVAKPSKKRRDHAPATFR